MGSDPGRVPSASRHQKLSCARRPPRAQPGHAAQGGKPPAQLAGTAEDRVGGRGCHRVVPAQGPVWFCDGAGTGWSLFWGGSRQVHCLSSPVTSCAWGPWRGESSRPAMQPRSPGHRGSAPPGAPGEDPQCRGTGVAPPGVVWGTMRVRRPPPCTGEATCGVAVGPPSWVVGLRWQVVRNTGENSDLDGAVARQRPKAGRPGTARGGLAWSQEQ